MEKLQAVLGLQGSFHAYSWGGLWSLARKSVDRLSPRCAERVSQHEEDLR